MKNNTPTSLEILLGRIDHVRQLARRLVRDGAEADDLVQQAVVNALGHPVPVAGDEEGWLRTVLRNLVRDGSRSSRRRDVREQRGARAESVIGSAESLAAAETQRALADAVLALNEPYRTTIVLRYFEDLKPRAIVERTGQTPAAVKKQLARGLAQLRAELAGRYGNSGAWAVALLPLAGRDVLGASALGKVLSAKVAVIGALTLAAAAAVFWALWFAGPPQDSNGGAELAGLPAAAGAAELANDLPATAPERTGVGVSDHDRAGHAQGTTVAAQDAPIVQQAGAPYRARVVSMDGTPMGHLAMTWRYYGPDYRMVKVGGKYKRQPQEAELRDERRASTNSEGWLSPLDLTLPHARGGSWSVDDTQLGVLLEGADLQAEGRLTLVIARHVDVAGHVVDAAGSPLAGVEVSARMELFAVVGFPLRLQANNLHLQPLITKADGSFDFGRLPWAAEFEIEASLDKYRAVNVAMPEHGDRTLLMTLLPRKTPSAQARILGVVQDLSGAQPTGLSVRCGSSETRTDPDGRFDLGLSYWGRDAVVTVVAADGRFASLQRPTKAECQRAQGSDLVRLVLPARMAVLRGRLLTQDGEPVPDMQLHLLNGTSAGNRSRPMELQGKSVRLDHKTGAFVLSNLQERAYHLRFIQSSTALIVDVPQAWPGEQELIVELPADALRAAIGGRVLDLFGEPVPGARVSLMASKNEPSANIRSSSSGATVLTDSAGQFQFEQVPWRGLDLQVRTRPHDSSGAETFPLTDYDLDEPLELNLNPDCEVHLEVAAGSAVDAVKFLDESGQRLGLKICTSNMTTFKDFATRNEDGTFSKLLIPQRARTMLLLRGKDELSRMPLRLSCSTVNHLQP